MKVKVGQVIAAYEAFGRLAKEKLPPKGGYWVARMVKKLEPEYVVVETRRTELVKELGQDDGKGGFVVLSEQIGAFVDRWSPILKEEIDVDLPKVKLEHFGEKELAVADLMAVEPFIEE